MTLDAYRDAWNRQDVNDRDRPTDEELVAMTERRAADFDRTIRRRDRLETLAAVVVILVFGFEAVTATAWLERTGAAIVVVASAFIVWWLRRTRSGSGSVAGDASAAVLPVAERVRLERDSVDAQIRLLESVLWWYLAPLALGISLFILGLGTGTLLTVASLVGLIIVYAVIWRINQRTVRRELRPRRERLSRLLGQLQNE
ncbi:MAG: hypothetical protein ACN0LA_09750 [Candidatus Longimicrobiales bacterium M2_2A_002]